VDLAREQRDAVARLPAGGRIREMQTRLARRLETARLPEVVRARVLESNAAALLHRQDVLRDEEHFEALHPTRTLLILLDDCDVLDADVLEAAPRIESAHDALRMNAQGTLAALVPLPMENDRLMEELVIASGEVRLLALAERLDHARHLHLRERADWAEFHRSVGDVYMPIAHRTHPRLARRYDWWWRMFQRRFLAPEKGV
jgi:hypothetical protein